MRWIRYLEESLFLVGVINCGRKDMRGVFLLLIFVLFWIIILLLFSFSLLRISENVLQVRLEFLGKTRDDFICVVNLFGFWFFNRLYVLYIWINNFFHHISSILSIYCVVNFYINLVKLFLCYCYIIQYIDNFYFTSNLLLQYRPVVCCRF